MSDFVLDVVRAEDLLNLRFGFVNFALDTGPGRTARLVRSEAGRPAFLFVHLGPQHIAERIVDEAQLEQVLSGPIMSVLADSSRLVFQLPDTVQSIPLTLKDLLSWTKYRLMVPANALPDPPGPHNRPGAGEPNRNETAIELPYGLILAPDSSAGWAHTADAVTHEGRTELWHTRLGMLRDDKVDESRLPTLRAVAAVHSEKVIVIDLDAVGAPLAPNLRAAIARQSADFSSDPSPAPLTASHLILSSQGGWTDLSGAWDAAAAEVAAWRQVVSMGRDQQVRIVQRGFLYPFGHRASLISVAERTYRRIESGEPVAYLSLHRRIVVQEPEKDYGALQPAYRHSGREMPIKRVRITARTTPNLVSGNPLVPVFPKLADGSEYQFHVEAEDIERNRFDFAVPMMFVPLSAAADTAALKSRYAAADQRFRRSDLRGQNIAFAENRPGALGSSTLRTAAINFSGQTQSDGLLVGQLPANQPAFLPTLDNADISIPAVDRLLGSAAPAGATTVTIHEAYLNQGFDPSGNKGEAFVRMLAPRDLTMPAGRSGGLVTPNMRIDGLTRSLGPVPGVNNIVQGTFNPSDAFGPLKAKLLGAIDLQTLIATVAPGASSVDLAKQVPKLVQTRTPDAVTTSYSWHPKVNIINSPIQPLVTTAQTALVIDVALTTPLNPSKPPSSTVHGTLSNFQLNLLSLIKVSFEKITFDSNDGHKMDLRAQGISIEFSQALRFLNALAQILPRKGFDDGPSIAVKSDSITTGYTLAIPTAGIGAFSLENITLSAELSLPLIDKPAGLRLGFSNRDHPFLVTLSMIGGGGFFALALTTRGIEQIEGAIEIGGNITIDLVVVSANVHVMAGFYFGMKAVSETLTVFEFAAFLRVGGAVEILGIVGVSIDFYVNLAFHQNPEPFGMITGTASVVVGAHLLMFSKTFTLSVECKFDMRTGALALNDPSFDDMITPADWTNYCRAFA